VAFLLRIARAGLIAALAAAVAGRALERRRFGASDEEAVARVEQELRQRLDASADTLASIAARVAAAGDAIRAAPHDNTAARRLFDAVDAALPEEQAGRTGITVYDAANMPVAWAGRVLDLPKSRIKAQASLFVAPSALGPRLVRVEPVIARARAASARVATIAVEQSFGAVPSTPGLGDTLVLATSIAPVTLRAQLPVAGQESAVLSQTSRPPGVHRFVVPSAAGGVLVEAEVAQSDLAAARARWRDQTWAAVLSIVAVTLLLGAGPLVDIRRRTRDTYAFLLATAVIAALVLAARLVLFFALLPLAPTRNPTPLDLLLTALAMTAFVWLGVDVIERRRFVRPRAAVLAEALPAMAIGAAAYAAAGIVSVWLLWRYERLLQRIVQDSTLDLLHFSLHPLNAGRLALAFALVLLHAVAIWSAAAIVRAPSIFVRTPRRLVWRAATAWLVGAALAVLVTRRSPGIVPLGPFLLAVGAAGACAAAVARVRRRAHRASQTARLIALFLAFIVPALAMYPSLVALATAAKERLVMTRFAPQAVRQRDELKLRLALTLDQIDALQSLPQLVRDAAPDTPTSVRAFLVWSKTDLATHRLTSAVELYNAEGSLISRFALSLPEYTTSRYTAEGCGWDAFEEVSPFGSNERHVLRASRGICEGGRVVGAIVVRAMLDYQTLPFISTRRPYFESLRPAREAPAEGVFGRDVEFAVYGWSGAPIYAAGTRVWTLRDDIFNRMVASRESFWATVERDGDAFRVYFVNDRGGIYALGYPVITWFGHVINLAELVTLTGVLYVVLLFCATLFNVVTSTTPASGRALLREVRSSFYRKLFLAFWAVAVLPVVTLAIATRTYFGRQLQTSVEQAAGNTATVAQRLVEDYATLQQRGTGALTAIDDQIMVLVRRAIDEDVNLFDRDHLQATSARDLFASQILSTRTPGEAYRTILLDRLPTYVGEEEVGDVRYRLAAAPVRAGGREGIVTVPLTSRQQQIETQRDELDRRVISAAVLFGLLGAAIGYWMAERIADPVNRLTRATRRIARGDLDARIAATSSDELRRLVEDFNVMAAELKRQRAELERTQRLEAWADMARQVAHDIKNPLTPIQLSAEHARRVNQDRGRPLSPVLDECVNAILAQVKLLRQISAEFSSFASAPTPRPEPTSIPSLVEEVVEPYRTGLAGRVHIDVQADGNLPHVNIDRTLFARALTNVVENALHAMPGRGTLTISTRVNAEPPLVPDDPTGAPGRSLIVEITDTGVGMDREALNKIFEPYFSTKATGTGLGLTIAKRNVELNGGRIDVRSEPGAGTTVIMTLPIN
jgi:signal transduction histidine kinase